MAATVHGEIKADAGGNRQKAKHERADPCASALGNERRRRRRG
jgi:hypothetical protein